MFQEVAFRFRTKSFLKWYSNLRPHDLNSRELTRWAMQMLLPKICELTDLGIYEPPYDKTNKVTVRPAKTQISLGIRPVWSESSLCAQWVAMDPSFLHVDSEDWSDWVDAQADLSLRWMHSILLVLSWGGSYGLELTTPGSTVDCAADCSTEQYQIKPLAGCPNFLPTDHTHIYTPSIWSI